MTKNSRLMTIALLSGCIFMQGCSSVKKTLGIDRDPPDEFAVTPSNQPLDMPPDFFVLPKPAPGIPRPQDVKAATAKQEKILGKTSQNGNISSGQQALLEMAGAEQGQDDIRLKIDEESHIQHAKGNSILQQLGIKKRNTGEAIDPYEESLELQNKGISPSSSAAP
ncbi:MAG: DUF3035 domain-containing protein [Proteobacteria bacterium]|nr:DUF3035 domain-containing protein [Pseudomonadota bacterium]